MISLDKLIDVDKFLAKPGKKINLDDYSTEYEGKRLSKEDADSLLSMGRNQLAEMQERLYSHNRYSVLIVFQAMDAAGKDSAIKHIMSGFNPQGVKVYSYKAPSQNELDHDFLWRHCRDLPARGDIGIFNRSHYENVLVTRVHPEYILSERLPGIDAVDKIDEEFWKSRLKTINRFEKNLAANGMIILKFYLNVSKKEQKKRFLERIDEESKNWKFSVDDLKERGFWDQYRRAYEEAISATSKDHAPWYVIPADDKWFSRLVIAGIIQKTFDGLDIRYPVLSDEQKEGLDRARLQLTSENGDEKVVRKAKKKSAKRKA